MKTTLDIDKAMLARLKREAARSGKTVSELVETAVRLLLEAGEEREEKPELPPLPSIPSGGHLVDIADRRALYAAETDRAKPPHP